MSNQLRLTTATYGGLSCRVVDALPNDTSPQLLVILCHGYGAPGDDLVPISAELVNLAPNLADKVQFVFPAAPLSLDSLGLFGGRAWWPVDVGALAAAIQQGRLRELLDANVPTEFESSRASLLQLVSDLKTTTGVPTERIVLGGFSQGAIIATDVALRLETTPAACCIMSGTLVCESIWRVRATQHATMQVLQSHGRTDPLVPYQGAIWLRDMFQEAGLAVDFIDFPGAHTIPLEAIEKLGRLLESRL